MSVDIATLSIEVDSSGVKDASSAMDGMGAVAGKLTGIVKSLAAAWAGWEVAKFARETALLSARYETMGVVMQVAGNNAGYTGQQMRELEKQMQDTGISMIGSREALTSLATANIDLSKATQLARAAQDVAVVGNVNSTEAFQRLIQGIKAGQTEILRTMGLNLQFEQGYKQIASATGKTVEQLTEQEKVQSRLNQVLNEASRYSGIYEAAMGTAGKQLLSMERLVENLKKKIGDVFGPSMTTLVKDMTNALKASIDWIDANSVSIVSLGDDMRSVVVSGESLVSCLSDVAGGADSVKSALEGFGWVVKGIGLAVAVTSDTLREAVADAAIVAGYLTRIPGLKGNSPLWEYGQNLKQSSGSALEKFLDEIEKNDKASASYQARKEALGSLDTQIQSLTNNYSSLSRAIDNARKANPKLVKQEDLDLLKSVGDELAKVKKRRDEISNPNARKDQIRTGNGKDKKDPVSAALDPESLTEYGRELRKLDEEYNQLTMSSASAYEQHLKNMDTYAGGDVSKGMGKYYRNAQERANKANLMWEAEDSIDKMRQAAQIRGQLSEAYTSFMFAEADAATRLNDEDARTIAQKNMLAKLYSNGSVTAEQFKDRSIELNKQLHVQTSLFGDLRDTINDWSRSSTDAFVEFCFTAKNTFGDLVTSMLKDLARLAVQKSVMDPLFGYVATGISAWLGSGSGTDLGDGGAWGGGKASGGSVYPGTTYLVGENGPELLHMGSAGSITPNGSLGQSINAPITVIIQTDGTATTKGGESAQNMKALGNLVASKCREVIAIESRPNGLLAR